MAYTISTSSGSTLATVADGTVNTTASSLTLIGKNYAGYGVFLNENYVKLLENFSNSTAPSAPLSGQLWYNNSSKVLNVYSDNQWKPISSSASGTSQPTSPVVGDLWWDTANSQLKVYSGSAWITIGPAFTATAGTSGAVVETIQDTSAGSHVVVKLFVSNTVVAIVSKDATFTPQSAIAGFSSIRPGINLISSSTLTGAQFTGDASNALSLNGVGAGQFLRSDQNTSTAYQITAGAGFVAGSGLEITTSSGTASIVNTTNNGDLDLYVNDGGVSTKAVGIDGATSTVTVGGPFVASGSATVQGTLTVTGVATLQNETVVQNTVKPNADNTIELGTSGLKFANVWATTFRGTAITANYADLAERFAADSGYPAGTVVELGGSAEITAVVDAASEQVFGVISTDPAYLMNAAAGNNKTHPAVALSGRVPVRVVGQVHKGDRLVSAGNGVARAATSNELTAFNVIGRALADKETEDEQLIEAIVRINN